MKNCLIMWLCKLFCSTNPNKGVTEPSENEAVNIVANMKNTDGKPRFSEKEVNNFKISCATKVLDFETVNAFKDNTNFNMNDMKVVYAMRRDLKDDNFYDKVNDAIAKMPNQKPDHFEQNKFEPNKEFSLSFTLSKSVSRLVLAIISPVLASNLYE